MLGGIRFDGSQISLRCYVLGTDTGSKVAGTNASTETDIVESDHVAFLFPRVEE